MVNFIINGDKHHIDYDMVNKIHHAIKTEIVEQIYKFKVILYWFNSRFGNYSLFRYIHFTILVKYRISSYL